MTTFCLRACVWELTLACDARCSHCGSAAGAARPLELTTAEACAVVRDLAALGCQSVTLSGGEPLLRRDWPIIARAVKDAGMRAELITNGLRASQQADAIAEAGFFAVSFSVDGPPAIHDTLRGATQAMEKLLESARQLKNRGVRLGAVTQVNRQSLGHLEALAMLLEDNGFEGWQVQLTLPHGRAAGQRLSLAPEQLPELEKTLLRIKARSAMFIQAADSIGYMSRAEPRLRTGAGVPNKVFGGCQAGLSVMGLTSDGTVRGCLSLPEAFDEGNIRKQSLQTIWSQGAFAYNRSFEPDHLTGDCNGCAFGKVCRGGCTSLAYAVTGTTTHTPHCLSRFRDRC